jgi:hypothetical protein
MLGGMLVPPNIKRRREKKKVEEQASFKGTGKTRRYSIKRWRGLWTII